MWPDPPSRRNATASWFRTLVADGAPAEDVMSRSVMVNPPDRPAGDSTISGSRKLRLLPESLDINSLPRRDRYCRLCDAGLMQLLSV